MMLTTCYRYPKWTGHCVVGCFDRT